MPNNQFVNLTSLVTLIVSFNKLQCIRPQAFNGLHQLRILSVHGNDISHVPQTAFRDLTSITHMFVAFGHRCI